MPESLENVIRDNAAGPKRAEADGVRVEQHSLADQIAAEKFLASKAAVAQPRRGLRINRIASPGAGERG